MLSDAGREVTWTDPAGTTSTYRVFTSGLSQAGLTGLVVFLDGDGMYGHDHPSSGYALGGTRGVVAQAKKHGYATLSIRAAHRRGTLPTFWEQGEVNAAYVAALIREVAANMGTTHLWLLGYSGGSQLITQFLLPAHAGEFSTGGAVITGGGGPPLVDPVAFDTTMQRQFPLIWCTGALDDGTTSTDRYNAIADAKQGHTWYCGHGFRTRLIVPQGLDHDDLEYRFGAMLASQLDANPAPAHSGSLPESSRLDTDAAAGRVATAGQMAGGQPDNESKDAPAQGWSACVSAGRRGVAIDVEAPNSASGWVTLTVTDADGRTTTKTVYSRGARLLLRIRVGLRRRTSHDYVIEHGGRVVVSGFFTTE